MRIPFVDLHRQHKTIAGEIEAAIAAVIGQTAFIGGEPVARFERDFAAYCEVEHCVGVANGTDSLELILRALDIGPGDEVITVANTFIATAAAIIAAGATPVFVDVVPDTYQMDVSQLPAALTPRTRAIMPVHLYGHPADMDPIMALAAEYGVYVIEDAAQAHGARYKGRRAGSIGHAGSFSFYPGKNLGAYGDGGAVVTNSAELAARVRQLADHGRIDKYRHGVIGRNSRLDALQAAILGVKLRHLDEWNAERRRAAAALTRGLRETGAVPPVADPAVEPVFHLYVVRTEEREAVRAALLEAGIASGIHYPLPLHLQPALAELSRRASYGRGSLPVTEELAPRILSLPIFAELQLDEIAAICAIVARATRPAAELVGAAR